MLSAFSTALSALSADSTAIDTVGNNLANLNTTGFKASTVSFQELVNQELIGGQAQPGFGVAPPTITQIYSQGAIQSSTGPYDAAIQGDGFFVVKDPNAGQMYTRAGNFNVDANGNLLTQAGQSVQGWSTNSGTLNTTGPISNIVIPAAGLSQPVATNNFGVQVNLDASSASGASFSTTLQVYDSLGETHDVQIQFQSQGSGKWGYTVSVPGQDVTGGTSGTPSQLATGTMTFDSQGNLLTPAPPPPASNAAIPIAIKGLSDGAADMNLNWNIWNTSGASPVASITQVAQPSAASNPTQDGTAAAELTGVSIGAHGEITAQYSSGQPRVVAQLALANIRNPESLSPAADGNLSATSATSLPSIGMPSTGGRGDIMGGALESSTVDIAREFTNMIVYQRSYEAASKVVTTANTLSQDTINIVPAQ